jgi:monovalent cation/hydrogen antiporter
MIGVLLLVMAGAVAVIALARRWGYQAGLVVMVAAGGVSFLPGVPRLELDPEVILGVVMPLLV